MSILNQMQKKCILVVGDVMLDTYYHGEIERISPEAPVPVFRKSSEESTPGGAANVAVNLAAAGQEVTVLSVVGRDKNGECLLNIFQKWGIHSELLVQSERKTTVKIRFLANNNQQVMRLDIEDRKNITTDVCRDLLKYLAKIIGQFHLILLSDYQKGLLSPEFTQGVMQLAKKEHIPVIIDVKDPIIEKYEGAYLLKPNQKELQELTGIVVDTNKEIVEASEYLRQKCGCRYVLTTCGARGMILVGDGDPYIIPSAGQEVFDVTGAGDTAIAYLAACIANRFEIRKSVDIANCAAGIQVSRVGTASVYWNEICDFLGKRICNSSRKLLSGDALKNFRKNNVLNKIVFTNGCFDILHTGHIRCLQEAASMGDILIVGINSDYSVKRLKGEGRPINSEQDRAEILCALECVDFVTIFEEDTPYELIQLIQPDVLVKGGDYKPEEVVGRDIVEKRGGTLKLFPFLEGKSTTQIVNHLQKDDRKEIECTA